MKGIFVLDEVINLRARYYSKRACRKAHITTKARNHLEVSDTEEFEMLGI